MIQELRDEACRQVYEQNGNAPPAPSRVLDLLGVSTVLERSNVSPTATIPVPVEPPGLLVPAADLLGFDASTDFDLQAVRVALHVTPSELTAVSRGTWTLGSITLSEASNIVTDSVVSSQRFM